MSTMFEAVQARPVYWDNMPYHLSPTLSRGSGNRDWVQSWNHVGRQFSTLKRTEAYARRLLAQRPGVPVKINQLYGGGLVAIVSCDALGRTWTDLQTMQPLL